MGIRDKMTRPFQVTAIAGIGGLVMLGAVQNNRPLHQRDDVKGKPNILFICTDQHGYKYSGFQEHPYVKTPNLDELAREGTVFTDAYAGAPVCTPSRASFMTGMYASDVGSYCNSTVWDGKYPVWGSYFLEAGYYTCAWGKLDLDDTRPMGFSATPAQNGHKHNPDITSLFRMPLCYRPGERRVVDGGARDHYDHHDLALTEKAVRFLKEESGTLHQPWHLYLGYVKPHPPFVALEKYYRQYYPDNVDMPEGQDEFENLSPVYQQLRNFKGLTDPVEKERVKSARAAYYAMITEVDELIGRVLQALKESGQYENTIIIYTSDHGESLGDHGLWLKNNLYDCAIRIPLIIKGPQVPGGSKVKIPVSQVDLTPTMLKFAGIEKPAYLRGKSLDRFFNEKDLYRDNVVYAENHSEGNCTGSFMIRKNEWKYIYFSFYDDLLFNLKADPGEKVNLADSAAFAGKKQEMKAALFALVDPDRITKDAFIKQKGILDSLVQQNSKEELFNIFRGRLGDGQAREITERLKGEF